MRYWRRTANAEARALHCYQRALTAGRTTRGKIGVVWVECTPHVRVRLEMHARLRHVRQAIEHGARLAENSYERRILLRDLLAYPRGERRRGVMPFDVNQVLDRDGHAVQGPDGLSSCPEDLVELARAFKPFFKEELCQGLDLGMVSMCQNAKGDVKR